MNGIIRIGSKDVGMTANAASPYLYKQIFHQDFLKEAQQPDVDASIFERMGFVMAKQAEGLKLDELLKLNETAFFEWLMEFEPLEILNATAEISNLYMGQTATSSVPKRRGG